MKKICLILYLSMIISMFQINTVFAEETESKIMELSIEDSVKYMKDNSREYWKLENSIDILEDSRSSAGDAKNAAEAAMDMPIGVETGLSAGEAYLNAILAKNSYYTKQITLNIEVLKKQFEQLDKSLEINAISSYYQLLASETTIQINEGSLTESKEQLRAIQIKFNNGTATKLDVLNGEMAVQNSQTDFDSSIDSFELMKLDFLYNLGLSLDTEIVLIDKDLEYEPTGNININSVIEKANIDRLEILTAKNNLILQEIETHAVKAYYTPNLAVYNEAVNNLEDAEIAVPNSYKEVELDVRKAYNTLIKSENSLLNMDKSLELAEESTRVTELLYNNGLASVLELLEANTNLKKVQIGRYNALLNYNINKMLFDNINIIS